MTNASIVMKSKGVFSAAILTAVLCFSGNVLAYSGGNGLAGNPYQIANVLDFNQLSATPTDWNKSFILTANINLASLTFTQAPIAPDTDSATSDFQGTLFTGIFDGNGHTISNLTINTGGAGNDFLGLFGEISLDIEEIGFFGEIKNLGLKNVSITGGNNSVCLGGLAGWNSGTISNCYSTGAVTGGDSSSYLGGLVGVHCYGTISNCYSTGTVSGGDNSLEFGGIAGENGGTISNCYSTGNITGGNSTYALGGLVGAHCYGTISNCYSTGTVTGGNSIYDLGGLVGYNNSAGNISNCYSTGTVSGGSGSTYLGGLVGLNNDGTLTACFWDINTSGQLTSAGGTGKTTAQMKTLSTFTNAGWDFSATDGDPADWIMLRPGQDYPRLAWQQIIQGDIAGLYGVNLVDYTEIAAHWGQTGCPTGCENADINGDGKVDINDLMLLADNWLKGF